MKDAAYEQSASVESQHWWYQGRAAILRSLVARYFPRGGTRILDVGCGTGNDLNFLSTLGNITGIDYHPAAVAACRALGFKDVRQGDALALPFHDGTFDVVCSFDVLNGIQHDDQAIIEAMRVLRKGGVFFVAVGAHPFLWGKTDDVSQHYRRYRQKELLTRIKRTGWTTLRVTHFNTFLFPLVFLGRIWERLGNNSGSEDIPGLHVPPLLINKALQWVLSAERFPLKFVSFPFGVSLLAIVRKDI